MRPAPIFSCGFVHKILVYPLSSIRRLLGSRVFKMLSFNTLYRNDTIPSRLAF